MFNPNSSLHCSHYTHIEFTKGETTCQGKADPQKQDKVESAQTHTQTTSSKREGQGRGKRKPDEGKGTEEQLETRVENDKKHRAI